MIKKPGDNGFTLTELLVVIALIAILVALVVPSGGRVQMRGAQTKALGNAKQIGLAMSLYAGDNDGRYPDEQLTAGKRNGKLVTNANQAFAQLIPTYLQTEAPFFIPGFQDADKFWWTKVSANKWSPKVPDNKIDVSVLDNRRETLKRGENAWSVMTGLTPRSDPRWPLIVEGANGIDSAFSTDANAYGGIWKGTAAIFVFNDLSAKIVKLDPIDHKAKSKESGADMLVYSAADNWLTATSVLVNPEK